MRTRALLEQSNRGQHGAPGVPTLTTVPADLVLKHADSSVFGPSVSKWQHEGEFVEMGGHPEIFRPAS
jgi:hypothetical protein